MFHLIMSGLQWLSELANIVAWPIFHTVACVALFVSISLLKRMSHILISRRNRITSSRGKAIMITGATSGFGLALSKFYHRLGFTIIACYYNDLEPGYKELSELNEKTGSIHLVNMDISSSESICEARKNIDGIFEKNPQLRLFCLVNNAGLGPAAIHLTMESRTMIERVCDINFRGHVLAIREFMPLLIRGQGRIVNVSSGLALVPTKLTALYSATKIGICQMSRCIQNETEHFGVKTIVVLPGNAIKNTNIHGNVVNNLKRAWQELDRDEKLIYERLFKRYEQFTTGEFGKMEKMKQGDTAARPYDSFHMLTFLPSLSEPSCTSSNEPSSCYFQKIQDKFMSPIFESLCGAPSCKSIEKLEDDSFLEAFDDAIRSVHPQSVLFPGNRWYQFLSGPIGRWLPDPVTDYFMSFGKPEKERSVDDFVGS